MAEYNVCIVADPLIVSLDGLPKLDIMLDSFKHKKFKKNKDILFSRKPSVEEYLRKDRKEMRAFLNQIGSTTRSKQIKKSSSIITSSNELRSHRKYTLDISNGIYAQNLVMQ